MNYRIVAAVIFSVSLSPEIHAQNSSPYSYFGLGAFNTVDNARNVALGNTGIALESENYLNSKNAAAIAGINEKSVIFDVGGVFKYNSISSNGNIDKRFNANFSNLGIGFGVTRNFAFSINLQPSTSSDYKIESDIPIEGTSSTYPITYEGTGGIANAGINAGYKITKNWLVGAKVKNYFGTVKRNETVTPSSDIYQLEISKNIRYTGFGYSFGTQYSHYFEDQRLQLTLGAMVNLKTKMTAKGETVYTADLNYNSSTTTTLKSRNTSLPLEKGLGFSMLYKDRYRLTFDYTQSDWNKVTGAFTNEKYIKQNVYGLGFELLPEYRNNDVFGNNLIYRFGVNYDSGYYQINNKDINKLETTVGVGFNIKRSLQLNLTYGYGIRGLQQGTAVRENYHMLGISVNFLENWFIRSQIN